MKSSTFELKTASSSTSIEMKMSGEPPSVRPPQEAGTTKKASGAFVKRVAKWSDEEYRQGYLEASIEQGIAWQIKANRKSRGLTQTQFAERLGTTQSGVSRLEDPAYGQQSLDTLVKVAHALDCALTVKFVPYSQLAEESRDLSEEAMVVPSFEEERMKLNEGVTHV